MFVGFSCQKIQSGPGNDEPYFIIGLAGANGAVTRLFGPYSAYVNYQAIALTEIAGANQKLVPPITIVVGMEHVGDMNPEQL